MSDLMSKYSNKFLDTVLFDERIEESNTFLAAKAGKNALALEERLEPSIT